MGEEQKMSECQQGMTKWQQAIVGLSKRNIRNTKGVKLGIIFLFLEQ
jgi:hypothetical protein